MIWTDRVTQDFGAGGSWSIPIGYETRERPKHFTTAQVRLEDQEVSKDIVANMFWGPGSSGSLNGYQFATRLAWKLSFLQGI